MQLTFGNSDDMSSNTTKAHLSYTEFIYVYQCYPSGSICRVVAIANETSCLHPCEELYAKRRSH